MLGRYPRLPDTVYNTHMPPRPLTVSIATLIVVLALANIAAIYWHLFYHIWWLDVVMHLAGGFWIALTGLTLYYYVPRPGERERSALFVVAFALALAMTIGTFWEVFEFSVDRMTLALTYRDIADTLGDLVNDFVGALIAAWIFSRMGYNKKSNTDNGRRT